MFLIALAGCDRSPSTSARVVRAPTKTVVQIKPITQLPPNRVVHVAVDLLGNVLYTYESDKGDDGAIIVGDDGVPRATQLTSANILAAMGESFGGSGVIQDLVAAPDGSILFYFIGGKGRNIRACLGRFLLRNQSIKVLFDTAQLKRITGMDSSIELARGSLMISDRRVSFFLRHIDAWGLFTFDSYKIVAGDESQLTRVFSKVIADGEELNLSQPRYELAAGPLTDVLLLDHSSGTLWQVDSTGQATVRRILTGLPRDLSLPLMVKPDYLVLFAADSDMLDIDGVEILKRIMPKVNYPALVQIKGKEMTEIGREDLRTTPGLPAFAMRIHQLVPHPKEGFVGYDPASGQLVQLKLVQE
ncbi:MAG TPA: hypothetical protein VHD56_05400 [Tepidisphaeraceae bacterium]|nr:hypothetical protein [Tepidisphaeraceae bacterium]